jgi:hypothetical protein
MLELDKKNEFVKAVFDYVEGGSINNAVRIFREVEKKHELIFTYQDYPYLYFYDDNWVETNLKPFLSETQLLVACDVYDDVIVYDSHFRQFGATCRSWGNILANWCNELGVEKPLIGKNKSRHWQYLDFYLDTYTSQWIQDYEKWSKAISEIILEKDNLFGSEYNPNNE